MLPKAVASVVAQELPADADLEVLVCVSDAAQEADREAAERLAASDARVRVAYAERPFPSLSRNAGINAARGSVLAFIDDDCEAQPGWLSVALEALEGADLVQGKTEPQGPVPLYHHSVWVDPPSWRWETCNLVVRKELVDRVGGFGHWRPEDSPDAHPFGEDIEWGWRLVRAGGRAAFANGAVVRHAVMPRDVKGYLRYQANLGRYPRLIRDAPEVRRAFYHGYFVDRRHAVVAAAAGLAALGGMVRAAGAKRTGGALIALAAVGYARPLSAQLKSLVDEAAWMGAREAVEVGSLLYGSVRWRRLLL